MINVQATNITAAAKAAFTELCAGEANGNDSLIWKEDAALISIDNPIQEEPAFTITDDNRPRYIKDYSAYVPDVDPNLVTLEEEHYNQAIFAKGHLDVIVRHLRRHPDSRRALISVWSMQHHLNVTRAAPCLTQLYFRLYNGKVDVHAHARACDAYRLLLLDMQVVGALHAVVADRLQLLPGRYIHFIDSLHFYKKYLPAIIKQREYIETAPVWQTL